jgi:hypothetical protein
MGESDAQELPLTLERALAGSKAGVLLEGLDGGTPLGFLSALGVLRIMSERLDRAGESDSPLRLAWRQLDAWRPIVFGWESLAVIGAAVYEDSLAWANAALLKFRYVKLEKRGPKAVGGLKAPAAVFRAWLSARRQARDEQAVEYAVALMCEEITEEIKGAATVEQHQDEGIALSGEAALDRSAERTFFDFTARNAQFLEQLECIRGHITLDRVLTALERGEADASAPRSMDWDPASDTPASIYTGYQRGFLPVHEWLAFRGLAYFPVGASGGKVRNAACSGRRLEGEFYWPLWEVPAGLDAIRSLVVYPNLSRLNAKAREALGITAVLCASLTKKADGRSGTFSPSRRA